MQQAFAKKFQNAEWIQTAIQPNTANAATSPVPIHAYEILADPMLSARLSTMSVTANVSKVSPEIPRLDAVSFQISGSFFSLLQHCSFSVPIPTPAPPPSDFPRPDIVVNCLADGVTVTVSVVDPNFHGVMYVKGHSNDRNCLRSVEQGEAADPLDFTVKFDTCGLFHSDVSFSRFLHYSCASICTTCTMCLEYFRYFHSFFKKK